MNNMDKYLSSIFPFPSQETKDFWTKPRKSKIISMIANIVLAAIFAACIYVSMMWAAFS